MTILSTAQAAAKYLGLQVPAAFVSSTDDEYVELLEMMSEAGQEIADAHDWQSLTTLKSETGDAVETSFPLPEDFNRFLRGGQVWTSRMQYALRPIDSADTWLEISIRDYEYVSGVWIRLGDSVQIKPTPVVGELIKYYYQSSSIWTNSGGTPISAISADADTFRLSERLLKLATVKKFRASKGLPFAEEMADFEVALSQAILDDSGSVTIAIGRRRHPFGDVKRAYPGVIT